MDELGTSQMCVLQSNLRPRRKQKICHVRFPNSVFPDYRTFASVDHSLREPVTYAVKRHSTRRGRSFRTPHLMRTFCSVLRRIPPQAFGVNRRLVWNVVREQNLHPFHRQKVQAPLGPSDFLRRNKFIGLFTKIQKIPTFPRWCCSRIVHASPEREFSAATTAMFGQKQTLMLHLLTGTNKALCSTFGRALLTIWPLTATIWVVPHS